MLRIFCWKGSFKSYYEYFHLTLRDNLNLLHFLVKIRSFLIIWSEHSYTRYASHTLLEKCLHSDLFWFVFSRILPEYGEMRGISPYSVISYGKYGPEKLRIQTLFRQWHKRKYISWAKHRGASNTGKLFSTEKFQENKNYRFWKC